MSKSGRSAPPECPVCGAAVPRLAKACPQCGADERTGWNEEATRYDGLDLPESAYEEDDVPRRGARKRRTGPNGIAWSWWAVGVGLTAIVIYLVVRRGL